MDKIPINNKKNLLHSTIMTMAQTIDAMMDNHEDMEKQT